jgi:hypothetical protein
MLEKCVRDQWRVDDLDWSVTPKAMSRDDEIAVVQYFTDMAGIERLAKALFDEQRKRSTDPILNKIFSTFVADEERHAVVAERLAAHYDVHHYRTYTLNQSLVDFQPHFLAALRTFSAEIANAYILAGELILDVALLRSINDHVDDAMSHAAMHLVNRDESRHIAIDYHMAEYYASDEYQAWLDVQPRKSLREQRRTAVCVLKMLYYAQPFFRDVFQEPMKVVDPDGVRMREAFKRIHLVSRKPGVKRRPFSRFLLGIQDAYNRPLLRRVAGPLLSRMAGAPGELIMKLYSEDELARAGRMSFDEMAEEALAAKEAN